ncbi:unnamed protein product, partial [Ectocarpus sp. 12 AP-2014]
HGAIYIYKAELASLILSRHWYLAEQRHSRRKNKKRGVLVAKTILFHACARCVCVRAPTAVGRVRNTGWMARSVTITSDRQTRPRHECHEGLFYGTPTGLLRHETQYTKHDDSGRI